MKAQLKKVTLSSLNRTSERQTLPVAAPPPVGTLAKIQKGYSLAAFLKRHGVTQEQLRLGILGLNAVV